MAERKTDGWWQKRLKLSRFSDRYLNKAFPSHPTFLFGEMALFSFVLLVITGVLLGMQYEPSIRTVNLLGEMVPAAYASVVRIDLSLFGQIIRNIHHWSAQLMIASLVAHFLRVYFTGAYRNPREINWLVGLALLLTTLGAAFTGYLLPYSEFSVTATSIGFFIAKSTPWIGDIVARLFFGGEFPSVHTIPRFFFYHVMLIPLIIGGLLGAHMVLLVQQKHTEPRAHKNEPESEGGKKLLGIPLWPNQVMLSLTFFFVLAGLVTLVATYIPINPVEKIGPPSPGTPVLRPEWYFLVVYGMLKLIPGTLDVTLLGGHITPETIGGVFFTTLIIVVLVLIPWIDRSRDPVHYMANPWHRPWATGLGLTGLVFLGLLMVAGYIDVLGISPVTMAWIVALGTLVAGVIAVGLLKKIVPKEGGGKTEP